MPSNLLTLLSQEPREKACLGMLPAKDQKELGMLPALALAQRGLEYLEGAEPSLQRMADLPALREKFQALLALDLKEQHRRLMGDLEDSQGLDLKDLEGRTPEQVGTTLLQIL